jgi:hypothetical protein
MENGGFTIEVSDQLHSWLEVRELAEREALRLFETYRVPVRVKDVRGSIVWTPTWTASS